MTRFNGTLDDLHDRLTALEGVRRAPARRVARRAGRRTLTRLAALALVALPLLLPAGLLAAGPFTDLNPGSPHNDNIAAIQAAGITKGCNPPAFDNYCPNGTVTREEMASFLARAAGLGANAPVANAATLQGRPASAFGRVVAAQSNQILTGASGGSVNAVSVTLTAPGPGYVLVNGATELFANACDVDTDNCRFTTTLTHAGSNAAAPGLLTVLGGGGKDEVDTVGLSWVFPVQAGPQLFTIQVKQLAGPAQAALLLNNQITALYVPFGGDGNTP